MAVPSGPSNVPVGIQDDVDMTTGTDAGTTTHVGYHAAHHNLLGTAVNALETSVLAAQGSFGSLSARLTSMTPAIFTQTVGATYTLDPGGADRSIFDLTLTSELALSNPATLKTGSTAMVFIRQDALGNHNWSLDGDEPDPTFTPGTTAGSVDVLHLVCLGSNRWTIAFAANKMTVPPPPVDFWSAVTADGPAAGWRFGETSGTTAAAAFGGVNGTYTGTYTLNQPSLVSGDTDPSVLFGDSATSYVTVPDANVLDFTGGALTIEFVWQPTSIAGAGATKRLIDKFVTGSGYSLSQFDSNGRLVLQTPPSAALVSSANIVAAATKYHVVATINGATGERSIYLNGQLAAQDFSAPAALTANTTPLLITGGLAGIVDDAAMYSKAFTANDVQRHNESVQFGQLGNVVWTANASQSPYLEWARVNDYTINTGRGTNITSSTTFGRVARVTTPTPLIGTYSYQITDQTGDHDYYTSTAQRTEIGQDNIEIGGTHTFPDGVDRKQYQGQDRWIAFAVRVPAAFTTNTGGADFCAIQQNKGQGIGNGPMSFYLEANKLSLRKSQSQTYGSTNISAVWTQPANVVRDQWIKLLLHVFWSINSDGFYELFGDLADGAGFVQLKARTDGWTLKYGSDGASPVVVGSSVGIYRKALASTDSLYFGGYTVATSRSAATRNAFGVSL